MIRQMHKESSRDPVGCLNGSKLVYIFGNSANASETPPISVQCLVSAEGRSVRKSQTWPQRLSFIGWLLCQTYLYWLAPPEDSL